MSGRVRNQLEGRERSPVAAALMKPMTMAALLVISVFALGAFLVLNGFAGDLRDSSNGKAHALSESAIGYAGIVELLRHQGQEVVLSREGDDARFGPLQLQVVTLTAPYQTASAEDLFPPEGGSDAVHSPVLLVLPKWSVTPLPQRKKWVQPVAKPFGPTYDLKQINRGLENIIADVSVTRPKEDDGTRLYRIRSREMAMPAADKVNIRYLQTLEVEDTVPILTANDKPVLVRLPDRSVYILSDPDFLNTAGISTQSRARLAQDMLAGLNAIESLHDQPLSFDLSVHGFGRNQNLIKTMLTPPFLAATLCLLAAGFLMGWQAFVRFGDPVVAERDHALGKYTLADNGARFIYIAGQEAAMRDDYADLITRDLAEEFSLTGRSRDDIAAFFARRDEKAGAAQSYASISERLKQAEGRREIVEAAQALHRRQEEIKDGRA